MAADGSSGAKRSGEGIPNIDSVKATIRTYYNADSDGIANKTTSPYINELSQLLDAQSAYLTQAATTTKPAIVLDTDDTTLWTYDMEDGAMHFNFDPTLQNTWVQDQRFPATPGMPAFVAKAASLGITVFGVTGRSDDQKVATLANLGKVGYSEFSTDRFFTKWTGVGTSQQPAYITVRPRSARRSSTRPRPASTSRAPPVVATTSSSTSATSGRTSRAGTPTGH